MFSCFSNSKFALDLFYFELHFFFIHFISQGCCYCYAFGTDSWWLHNHLGWWTGISGTKYSILFCIYHTCCSYCIPFDICSIALFFLCINNFLNLFILKPESSTSFPMSLKPIELFFSSSIILMHLSRSIKLLLNENNLVLIVLPDR